MFFQKLGENPHLFQGPMDLTLVSAGVAQIITGKFFNHTTLKRLELLAPKYTTELHTAMIPPSKTKVSPKYN